MNKWNIVNIIFLFSISAKDLDAEIRLLLLNEINVLLSLEPLSIYAFDGHNGEKKQKTLIGAFYATLSQFVYFHR